MRRYILVVLGLCASAYGVAQTDGTKDFQAFRQQMLSGYQSYRGKVLDDYAKYLDAVWKDYKAFQGKERYSEPKPHIVPEAPAVDATPGVTIPIPDVPLPSAVPEQAVPVPVEPTQPTEPSKPAEPSKPSKPSRPAVPDLPIPAVPKPTQPAEPALPKPTQPKPAPAAAQTVQYDFYTLKAQAPKVELPALAGADGHSIGVMWKQLQEADVYGKVQPALDQYRRENHLNDWLTYGLVHAYADALYPADDNASAVLTHYLLAHMGYNIRLGRSGSQLLLLVPFRQTVYVRPYLDVDGTRYSIFMYEGGRDVSRSITTLSTCQLPADADLGHNLDLVIGGLTMPRRGERQKELSDGVMTLSLSVPEVAVDVAGGFVQTEIPVYAGSCLSESFRTDLLSQVKSQIQGLTEAEAVSRLMHFIQFAFDYATDTDQFGYEKPFFVEENFYYPANDCEDRAVLLAFLVRQVLGLDVHLLHYHEHEAAAICFTDQTLQGDGYTYRGRRYLICDPTYIGAGIGQCMPRYEGVKPEIEL